MDHELLFRIGALFVCAKLMGLRLPFYSAALLAVASLYLIDGWTTDHFGTIVTHDNKVRLITTLILYFSLDRLERKPLRWLLLFAITCYVLIYYLP